MLRALTWIGLVVSVGTISLACVTQDPDEDAAVADDALGGKGKGKHGGWGKHDGKGKHGGWGKHGGKDGKDKDGKVQICHVPPGNPAKAHTIRVGESAVPAHLAHGDILGGCGGDDYEDYGDDDDDHHGGGCHDDDDDGSSGGGDNACLMIGVICGDEENAKACCSGSCIDGLCTTKIVANNPDTCITPDETDSGGFSLVCDPGHPCCTGSHCIDGLCQLSEWLSGGSCSITGETCNHLDEDSPKWCCWDQKCVGLDEIGNGHCE